MPGGSPNHDQQLWKPTGRTRDGYDAECTPKQLPTSGLKITEDHHLSGWTYGLAELIVSRVLVTGFRPARTYNQPLPGR